MPPLNSTRSGPNRSHNPHARQTTNLTNNRPTATATAPSKNSNAMDFYTAGAALRASSHSGPNLAEVATAALKKSGFVKIGRFAGADIWTHSFTFKLLPLISVISGYCSPGTAMDYLNIATYLTAIPTSLLIHECSHAFIARKVGVEPKIIICALLNGRMIADRGDVHFTPQMDRRIAFAGPASNLLIAGALLGLDSLIAYPTLMQPIAYVNLFLALSSLRSSDGQRIFRSFFPR